ncbi:hypothetical protein SEA_SONALI_78 [Arthrobacter phage Sonali]|uniref:Uncharacterized protein n=1 Tax=Arthrobacter phage Sonali TaxID=2510495 RepID=A0A411CQX5_9CAUD|nr:hypothetical protein HOV09_gp78 [Arthrobacter phage Sonali]QAY16190.1 hypothetical protein SEA_SONALI_78 [Arthrobacter phage Sonali]
MIHDLVTYPNAQDDTVIARCSCDQWRRVWNVKNFPGVQEAESDHQAHRQAAAAQALQAPAQPVLRQPEAAASLDALVNMTRAIGDAARAMQEATATLHDQIDEFIQAHQDSCDRGIGVLVVRKADGTITSTPNVFLKPGQVVFTEDPETYFAGLPVKISMAPEVPEYLPRYQVTTPVRLESAITTKVTGLVA